MVARAGETLMTCWMEDEAMVVMTCWVPHLVGHQADAIEVRHASYAAGSKMRRKRRGEVRLA